MKAILRRLNGYRRRGVYEWSQWRARRDRDRCQRAVQAWVSQLQSSPPYVLVGANFAAFGGVRGHIQAIQRHSKLDIELVPPESLVRQIGVHSFTEAFNSCLSNFPIRGVKVAHSHVYPWFIDWCRRQQQAAGLRWVHTYHLNYYPEHGIGGVLEPWQKEINDALIDWARYADICLSVSRWQVDELRKLHGIEAKYIPNGVDVAACDQGNAQRFRRKHRLEVFVLYVGRNDPVKNPLEFVQLARRLPELIFVMIGGGLCRQTMTDCDNEVLPENLKIIGGLPPQEVQDAIAACSLLVVTSKREGLPTLVLEAMTHQKPVVVPEESGCLEAIGQGKFGYVYCPGDIDDLTLKTLKALESGLRNCDARQHVLQEYDWRVVGKLLDETYIKLVDCN